MEKFNIPFTFDFDQFTVWQVFENGFCKKIDF